MGCFWGAEQEFWQIQGVWVTAVGFSGRHHAQPDLPGVLHGPTGHTEVVLVVFDPRSSLRALLKAFWETHDPTQGMRQGNDVGTTYRSAIYTYDDAQLATAMASRECTRRTDEAGYGKITTEIPPAPEFYFAEDYHQQYLAKNPYGYCPNHRTGVLLPDVAVTPLQYAK